MNNVFFRFVVNNFDPVSFILVEELGARIFSKFTKNIMFSWKKCSYCKLPFDWTPRIHL